MLFSDPHKQQGSVTVMLFSDPHKRQGDTGVLLFCRTVVLDTLNSIGLQDPHRQLQKELDSWDIWNIEETDRKKDLKKMCSQWLDRYFPPSSSLLLLLLCVFVVVIVFWGEGYQTLSLIAAQSLSVV